MKNKKPKKQKKPNRKQLIKLLDKLWSKKIREIWFGICSLCGKAGTQAHHFFTKGSHGNVRWNIFNGMWVCFNCHHFNINKRGEHEKARDILISKIGLENFNDLKGQAYSPHTYSIHELRELVERLS